MIKLVYCLRRLPELSREQFQQYWFDKHAPLVRKNAETLRIRRYVQAHSLDDPMNEALRGGRGGAEPYDGVAELWWDTVEDLQEAMESPDGQVAALELATTAWCAAAWRSPAGSSPVGEQCQEVGDADDAVAVEVAGAAWRAWGVARTPGGEQGEEIDDRHFAVAVEVARDRGNTERAVAVDVLRVHVTCIVAGIDPRQQRRVVGAQRCEQS